MSGIMNNYFYGKAGKADYTPENLPSNRVALFFEMLRLRLTSMIGMNLFCILTAVTCCFHIRDIITGCI